MTKPQFKALWVATVALAAGLALDIFLASRCGLRAVSLLPLWLLPALLVVMLAYVRQRLSWLADVEKRDQALAATEAPQSTIFNEDEDSAPFSMARSRQQFERFVVPFAAPLLGLVQLWLAWHGWRQISEPLADPKLLLPATAFMAGQAFVFFLLSRYLLGLSSSDGQRLMKGPGIYLGLSALCSMLAALAAVLTHAGIPRVSLAASWIFIVLWALLGTENLLRSIAFLYRLRTKEAVSCVSYETRLGALLTDPASWVNNIAQALDYQFGFNVSQTWFYRFLENALAPLIIFQIAALYLLSCFVFLGPEEEGILEKFGRPVPAVEGGLLDSGFHLKWPWPFETVRRFPSKRIQTLHIGNVVEKEGPAPMLWTVQHHTGQENFLTASRAATAAGEDDAQTVPVNLLSMHIPVEYRITNIYQYAFSAAKPLLLLEQAAYAGLTRFTVSHGMEEIISSEQIHLTQELKSFMQRRSDELGLGLWIEFVGLQGVHPPISVAAAFESVVGALEERESTKLQASAYAAKVLPLAAAEAAAAGEVAASYRVRRKAMAAAEAYQFVQRRKGYERSPQVFKKYLYLRTLSGALAGARKYIVSADPGNQVIQFDFKEKLKPDLFNFGPGSTEESPK